MELSRFAPPEAVAGVRFLAALPWFLHQRPSPADARATLRERLERREGRFLATVRRCVYQHPESPYLRLLRWAGCDYDDISNLVARDGVDGALEVLYREGVYLTVDELKGRRAVVRGSSRLEIAPGALLNPLCSSHVPARTGGSRSQGTPIHFDLRFIRDCAVDASVAFEALGGLRWVKADWEVPGAGAIFRMLKLTRFGETGVRWFSHLAATHPGLHPRYRWSARLTRWCSLAAGAPLPAPTHVPLTNPLPIARWMGDVLRSGRTPFLFTFPSSAVQLCRDAREAGIDLSGAWIMISGEPITAARVAVIRSAGARPWARFGSIEAGAIGYGCQRPRAADDLHILHDRLAVIQAGAARQQSGLPHTGVLLTALSRWAPLVLLNASLGDQAEICRERCGCPLERAGWTTHIHTIRSFEKLTGAGMTFLGTDVIQVLEQDLPNRFGGEPGDFQLVEEEGAAGEPRLVLLASPRLGTLDDEALTECFLSALERGDGAERVMGQLWRQAGLVMVKRQEPRSTSVGKRLHLHIQKGPSDPQ